MRTTTIGLLVVLLTCSSCTTDKPPTDVPDTTVTDTVKETKECESDADCVGKMPIEPCQKVVCNGSTNRCEIGGVEPQTPCNDGDACTIGERCDGETCTGGLPPNCDDGNPCTTDSCSEGICTYAIVESACDDGDPCTGPDNCVEGKCDGAPIPFCFGGPCCTANGSPGCEDPTISECVCAADATCCESMWSESCVSLVNSEECGSCAVPSVCGDETCDPDESCDSCPADCGPCTTCGDEVCEAPEDCKTCADDCGECPEPVCGDEICDEAETCEACPADCGTCPSVCGDDVCALDESCQKCPADCGVCPEGCGDGVCTVSESCESCALDCGVCVGDCCDKSENAGCSATLVAECVCAEDPYCCNDVWDGVCVAQVETLGCATCDVVKCGDGFCQPDVEDCESCPNDCGACPVCGDGTCDPNEDCNSCKQDCGECASLCCQANPGPGCGNPAIEACVCAFDSYCCNFSWDSLCASEVETYGCATCP